MVEDYDDVDTMSFALPRIVIWGIFMSERDLYYMQRAIELAENGVGLVNPNPLVGCVIVKDDNIIGEGWHHYFGGPHAERDALARCCETPENATLYVTLEPCCHHGKTPPCTDAIIENKISRVVIGIQDPNKLVAGKGIKKLRDAGIEVLCGIEEHTIREQNRVFLKYITTQRPWICLKTAMSLDGKIATITGDSKWISNEKARRHVHTLRGRVMAVMTGIETVLADDPMLNCRLPECSRQPIRVVVDSRARTPLDSNIVRSAKDIKTIIAHTDKAKKDDIEILQQHHVITLCCKGKDNHVDLHDIVAQLSEHDIDSIMLEAGGTLNFAFLNEDLIDEVYAFVAPKILGGKDAKTPIEGEGFTTIGQCITLNDITFMTFDDNIMVRGKIKH